MRRLGALVAAAALTATSLAAEAQPSPAIEAVPDGIASLLRDYGTAFETADPQLLGSTIGEEGLEAEKLEALRNAADVPFASYVVRASTQFSGNLASPRIRRQYPGHEVRAHHVIEEIRLDVEDGPSADHGVFTFTRRTADAADRYGGWRLVSMRDVEPLGFFSPHHMWDSGPVSVLRSPRFLLLTHPEVADEVGPLLEGAERAYDRALDFWPHPVDERYVILVPATTEELGDLIRTTLDLSKFVAFATAGALRDAGWEPLYPRLVVHLPHMRNYGSGVQEEILAHELLHAVTRPISGPRVPIWVEEGLANIGGGRGGRPNLARGGGVPGDFPSDDEFLTGSVTDIQRRYDQGEVAIEVLLAEHGTEGLVRFYTELGSARVAPGTATYHLARATQRALGWTVEEWRTAWQAELAR